MTKLPPFERFVLVISILERYSNWDSSLLLGCCAAFKTSLHLSRAAMNCHRFVSHRGSWSLASALLRLEQLNGDRKGFGQYDITGRGQEK